MTDIYLFLKNNAFSWERFDHPAVFTCEEAKQLCPEMPGRSIKNMFLYDNRSEDHFLVVVGTNKQVDLKHLKSELGASKLSFCSEERLKKYLGVEPGSVTLLGLINDHDRVVQVIFDAEIWGQSLQCHPLVNTATLVIPPQDVERFLQLTGHRYQIVSCQARQA